jgi:CRISPR type III-A-associated RAMP protein Csm4
LEKFLDRCAEGNPDFVISSTFPFKQQGRDRIPFFPNPLISTTDAWESNPAKAKEMYRLRKNLKNIKYLHIDDFESMLHGNLSSNDLLNRLTQELERKKQALNDDIEYIPLPQTVEKTPPRRLDHSMTHNTIDRLRGGTLTVTDSDGNEAGQLFHAEDTWWIDPDNETDEANANTGLFFLVDGDTSMILPVLRLLRHWGIGADRTAGKGVFDFEAQPFTMPEPNATASNTLVNLSLFRPTEAELLYWEANDGCIQYSLEQRGGYVGGYRQRRPKNNRMYFKEASIFSKPAQLTTRHMGCIHAHEFTELPHKVWDNGFGFMVNLNWKEI